LLLALKLHDASSAQLVYYYREKEDSRGASRRIFTEESMEKNEPALLQKERKSALAGAGCGPIQMFDPVLADPGVHTREVLASLGYSHGDIDAPAAAGVIEVTQ
jgi:hypothetical protein